MTLHLSAAEAKKLGVQAKGRRKPGCMNRTEAAYAEYLEQGRRDGLILWYAFDAVKFRLGEKCWYSPDFLVIFMDGIVELHEVKGFWRDDARVKIKVAAERFPFVFRAVKKVAKKNGGWAMEDF